MGLTQRQLGELVGMDAPAISRIERGHRSLSYDQVSRLASALDLEVYVGPPRAAEGTTARRAASELSEVFTEASNELARLQEKARDIARRYQVEAISALQSDAEEIRAETDERLGALRLDPPRTRRE